MWGLENSERDTELMQASLTHSSDAALQRLHQSGNDELRWHRPASGFDRVLHRANSLPTLGGVIGTRNRSQAKKNANRSGTVDAFTNRAMEEFDRFDNYRRPTKYNVKMDCRQPDISIETAIENERIVVGLMLLDSSIAADIAQRVSPGEFIDQTLGKAFTTILNSVSAGRAGMDVVADVVRAKVITAREASELMDVIRPEFATLCADEIRSYWRSKPDEPESHTRRASKLFGDYLGRLRRGDVVALYDLPDPFDGFEIGPGLISCWGAGPGTGKTAAASQLLFGALELNPSMTVTIANAEMSFDALAQRELCRRTSVKAKDLRFGTLTDRDWEHLDAAAQELEPLLERVRWLNGPYDFMQLTKLDDDPPGLLALDYLQKFAPAGEVRQGVNSVMTQLRSLANKGWAVLALSATTRTTTKGRSSHSGDALSLASFKESGEIEFNADSAYLLRDEGPPDESQSWIKTIRFSCVKNRHGAQGERETLFNAAGMRFSLPAKSDYQGGPFDFGEPVDNPHGLDDSASDEGFTYGGVGR